MALNFIPLLFQIGFKLYYLLLFFFVFVFFKSGCCGSLSSIYNQQQITHPKKVTARKEGRREGGSGERKERGKEEREESWKHEEMAGMTNNGSMEAQRYQTPVLLLALQWCCWMCACLWGGEAFTVNTQKKSTQKNTTNKEASRDTQHSDAKPQQTVLQELRQVCVYRYAEMRAKGKRICMRHAMAVKLQQRTQSMLHMTV